MKMLLKAAFLTKDFREKIHFQYHSGCWPNSVHCAYGCRNEVPVISLPVRQRPVFAPMG